MIKKVLFFVMILVSCLMLISCSSQVTVTFKYENGTVIEEVKVNIGEKINAPEVNCEEGFEFDKWSIDLETITESCEVTPIFKKIVLNVNFYVNDELLESKDVEYGDSVTAPTAPALEGFDFKGWDKEFTVVKENLNVNAVLEAKKFNVKFLDKDGNELQSVEVEYGKDAEAPKAPELEGLEFIGWDKEYKSIKEDLEVKALYEVKKFNVKFLDKDGNELQTVEVEYGKDAEAPTAPVLEGYEFISWDNEFKAIKEDLEVKAIYEKIEYIITYYDGTQQLSLTPDKYDVETLVFTPEYEKAGFEFLGWFETENSTNKIASFGPGETGNKVFYAKFEEIKEAEKIKLPEGAFYFSDIKQTPHSSNPNLIVFQPNLATAKGAPSTSVTKYDWKTSDASIATISQWSTITKVSNGIFILSATYKDDPSIVGYAICKVTPDSVIVITEEEANKEVTYTVTFKDINGKVIDTQTVKEGGDAVLPTPPVVEGKAFDGWDKLHYNIEADVTITATYRTGTNKYVGKTVSILGDSISTYKGFIPEGYATFYPYSTAGLSNYNETWWMQVINKLGMKLHANNSWGGSCVSSGTGSSATVNDERLSTLLVDGVAPDVIIIFMGNNDCASKYVQHSTFDSSYKTMMDKIKKLCPNAEIVIMTLPPAGSFFNESDRILYNQTIIKYANEYNCKLVELTKEFEKCDSIHPKKKGMDTIFEQVYSALIK